MSRIVALLLPLFLGLLLGSPALGQLRLGGAGPEGLLEPEKAFRFSVEALDERTLQVRFDIAEGYYMYRERFRFALEDGAGARLGEAQFPPGKRYKDEFFGDTEIYRNAVRIVLPVEGAAAGDTLSLLATSQGCADQGVCYVPMESRARVRLTAGQGGPAFSEAPRSVDSQARFSIFASDFEIARLFEGSIVLVIASFLAFGVLLAFTPCVLPMIPILSSIIAGEGGKLDKPRALALSVAYVLGMAIAYAIAGVAAAFSGSLLAAALQNVWVLGSFALVFVALALSMFGLYELRLPQFLHARLDSAHRGLRGGRIASVAAMGVLSAVIVSPCVAAPLAGALLYISQTRDVALGGSALFAMALGMGIPLIAVGVSEGALMPRAGAWMDRIKRFFGVLLLGVALWVASPVLPAALVMAGWAALLIGSAVFLGALDRLSPGGSAWRRLWKALGLVALVYGVALLVGALGGSRDPLRPLAGLFGGEASIEQPVAWAQVSTPTELDDRLRSAGKVTMLDFYADWCVSCKEMERFTFSDPRVRARMNEMQLLQADVTANTEAHKALLKRFSLFGPPGIIFFDERGREIKGLRVVGYQSAERFLRTLDTAAAP